MKFNIMLYLNLVFYIGANLNFQTKKALFNKINFIKPYSL